MVLLPLNCVGLGTMRWIARWQGCRHLATSRSAVRDHDLAERQLAREGIAYQALDNGVLSCAVPQTRPNECRDSNGRIGPGPMPIARRAEALSARVRAASYPAWPIVIEPGSGSLCASESIKLLLRAFRPSPNDEIAVSLRRKNFEDQMVGRKLHVLFRPS